MKNHKHKILARILFVIGVVSVVVIPYFLFARFILKFRWQIMLITTTLCILSMMFSAVMDMKGYVKKKEEETKTNNEEG